MTVSLHALHKMGVIDAGIRLPMVTLAEQYHGVVLAAMEKTGVDQAVA